MTIYTRLTKIDIERFSVDLTARGSDLADVNFEWRPRLDDFYDREQEDQEKVQLEAEKKRKAKCNYIRRVIVHPSFHNIAYKDAERLLQDMEQGEVIIRPSSKGPANLTVSWKVTDSPPIITHIDVKEENKENEFSLGQSLWIGDEEFEDLDEIIARHIQPMAAFCRDMLNHKYFREAEGGNREIMQKMVQEEKKKAPSKIPYYFSASKDFPGKFLLCYAPKLKPRHEFMTVTPDGIRFRGQIHHSLNACVNWFKEHFKDPIPGGTPMSLSGRTPMQNARGGGGTPQFRAGATGGNTPTTTPFGTASVFQTPAGTYGAAAGTFPSVTPRIQPTPILATPGRAQIICILVDKGLTILIHSDGSKI
jgi:transcription elongation factor SPT6